MMPEHRTGTREEWQAVRAELAQLDAEQAQHNAEIQKKRLELPWIAARLLRARGLSARPLQGGLHDWRLARLPVSARASA
jgi:hypothetical protein